MPSKTNWDDFTPVEEPVSKTNWDDFTPVNEPGSSTNWDDFTPVDPSLAKAKRVKQERSWVEAASDTAIDVAKGAVGLGESAIGLADLATGNLVGKGWGELGYDPARTKQMLSEGYSDSRQQANRNVADAKGFWNTAEAMVDNPSSTVGSLVESAPMTLTGAGAVRAAATRMLASRGLVAGSSEAAAFLANPATVARLTAIGSASEGAMTSGSIQEQGRQAGRDYADTAPSALAAGAVTGAIGFGTSKIPGFRDAEVGAALAGMGSTTRQGLITAGKEISKGMFKEGVLEEMPQSAQEQVFTNLALGNPWDEGVAEAAAQGMVAGAGMGGGLNTYSAGRNAMAGTTATPDVAPVTAATPGAVPPSVQNPSASTTTGRTSRPEVRLAELDLTSQNRELSPQERAEFTTLVRAMDSSDPTMDANRPQAPVFDDVPDFPIDSATATVQQAQAAINSEAEQPAPAGIEQQSPRTSWAGLKNGDRVQTIAGTTGTLKFGPGRVEAYLVHDTSADGTPNTTGGMFSVLPGEIQRLPGQVAPVAKLTWFGFLKEKGVAPGAIRKDTPQWETLKAEFADRNSGVADSAASVLPVAPAEQAAIPNNSVPAPDLQNRDRSRAASVMQMAGIARNPDYGRLGTSRTPDSGAPMVFSVDDILSDAVPDGNGGNIDTAVMADGQRVRFRYAVVSANSVEPSHFADGRSNPGFSSKMPGTLKALNNGRTAGLRAAHESGTADTYVAELIKDAPNHGVSPAAIERTPNPVLVRLYAETSNTHDMAAKSQGQGLGMSPAELARQDAPLLDATVLTAYRHGDVSSANNRDFVRAFVGKMVQAGQDVAGMMTGQGTLSPAGRIRIQAALVQAAYGDAELVQEMFESQDSDIKSIGEALKTLAGKWADMRDSAREGAIDAHVDITDNLVQAVNLIRKSRQDHTSLIDLVNQPDLMTGEAPDELTTALLRVFYTGKYLTRALGREQVVNKLNAYVQAAMSSSHGADMFGEQVTVAQILETITQGAPDANTPQSKESRASATGLSDIGSAAGEGRPEGQRSSNAGRRTEPADNIADERQTEAPNAGPSDQQADQGTQAAGVTAEAKPPAKIEDAGQKIGGARKDRWKEHGLSLGDLDSMSESEGAELATKANVWKPDYAAMVQGGARPDTAAFIKVVYDSLAAKPKDNTPEGRRRYVTMMQHVRQAYSELAKLDALETKTARKGMTDAAEALKVRLGLRSQDQAAVKEGKALLFSVYKGRSDPFVVGMTEDQRARKLVADGFPASVEPWKKRLSVSAFGGGGLTERGLEIVVKEALAAGTPVTAEQVKAGVYRVSSKAGKALAYLHTMADAEAAAKTIYEGKLKSGASDKAEPSRPHLDTLKRDNLPQRIDRDAVADDFVKDFGFRGIEFGNWAAQDERQRIINMAYDGLMDLAEIMGLPPKALSLNGTLGMAFGARGGGKFAAHYEPGKLVINMTKLQGGGSMAHEWAHALDHYFGELNQKDAYTTNARGASGWYTEDQYKGIPSSRMEQVDGKWVKVNKMRLDNMRPEMAKAFDDVMSALFSGQETKAEMVRSLELQLERTQTLANSETDPQTKAMYARMAESQAQNLVESRNEPDGKTYPKGRSLYAGQAQALSGKSANGYWSRPTEMFARAFESWAFDKVVAMGAKSDYLVHGVEEARFAGGQYKGNPYPTGQERATINTAFDKLVKTFKTRQDDAGNVALYQEKNGEYDANNEQAGKPDDRPSATRNIGMLNRAVARAPGAEGADTVLPYVGRLLPGNEQIDRIAAAFGDTIQGFGLRDDLTPAERRKFGFFNGAYFKGVIYMRDSGHDRPHLSILGHELAHRMAASNPALYAKLVAAIDPYINQSRYDTEFRQSSVARKVTTEAGVREEFIGEVLSDGFMDKAFWRAIGKTNPTLLSKVRDFIGGLIDTIKAQLGHLKRTERILNDYDKVMQIAGEIMGEFGIQGETNLSDASNAPAFNRTGDQTDKAAFLRWFGDSKVVDKDGQPLVVYHGTTRDFSEFKSGEGIEATNDNAQKALGFFFTNKTSYVNGYIEHPETRGDFADGARILPVYLALRNPKILPISKIGEIEEDWSLDRAIKYRRGLEQKGYDGIIFASKTYSEYVAFRSNQIKSSVGNNGDFDGANSDIMFNRNSLGDTPPETVQPAQGNVWTALKNRVMRLTTPENIDKLIYEFQDKHIDLKRIRDHIKELGGTISDLNDAYLGEELFHKRLAKRTEDFLADELKPLLASMRASGVAMDAFETFLHARHAPEANAAMAKRNPNQVEVDAIKNKATKEVKDLELKLQQAKAKGTATKAIEASLAEAKEEARNWFGAQPYKGTEDKRLSLSGMSDDEAAAYMASLNPRKREHMTELAAMVDAINAKTLDTLESYGLMDSASLNAWRNAYEFYVPLHRDEAKAEGSGHPVGMGFSVKGNAAKQRTGSNHKVTHILGHIAMQREAALTRGEKNHVAKKLFLMAAQNPDDSVWSVDKPPMTRTIDPNTGIVRTGVDPLYKTRPNVLMVRIAGKDVAVVFNEDNPQAMRMVESLKNMDIGDLHVVLGLASKGTRWFASVNTQYNPIFGLVNFARDVQEAMVNLSTTPLAGKQLEVVNGVAAAMRAVYRQGRGKGAANADNAQWIKLWDEMQLTGGATGYRDLYANAEERVKSLTKELQALDRGEVSQAAHAVLDWLSDYNEAMENSVRLSAYKVALDNGMTKERAASLAKSLTVNFNRKGRQTREIGALYAFFNAAVQGTTRMAETLKGPMGKKIMLGGVTLGVVNTLVGMAMMGGSGEGDDDQDEWAKIPEFIKENSLIIPIGRKDYLTIPMPLGFKVFPNVGRLAVEFALGGSDKTATKGLGKLLGVLVDAFNPLGGTQNMGQMVAPTVIDPVVALMQNRDWTGRPIYRENNNPLNPQPGTKTVKDSASTVGKGLAAAINAITGGTQYRPGAWSPTPDQIDYVFGQLTGGLGRELLKANQVLTAPFTGDELPPHKIPLIGRLYGNTSGPAAQAEHFYENIKMLNEVENELKGRLRNKGDATAYRESEPLADLIGRGNAMERTVSRLRANRRMVVERANPGYQVQAKAIDKRIGELMSQFNNEVVKSRNEKSKH